MRKSEFDCVLSIQSQRQQHILRRKPFLKMVESTKNDLLPLYYDPRTEDVVLSYIRMRMMNKLRKRKYYHLNFI